MIDSKYYNFLPDLFLRAPHYSFSGYDLLRLPVVLQQRDFLNAIWLASPGFFKTLERRGFKYDQLDDRQKHTLKKYYNRICFRQTPFGSFASFTLLQWEKGDPVRLPAFSDSLLHLLPDQQLIQALHDQPSALGTESELMINPCLYRMNQGYRYIKSTLNNEGHYSFTLEAIDAGDFLDKLFMVIRKSEVDMSKLLVWIKKEGECTEAEALDYLLFLIREQVLLTRRQNSIILDEPYPNARQTDQQVNEYWKKYRQSVLNNDLILPVARNALFQLLPEEVKSQVDQPFYSALEKPLESGGPSLDEQVKLSEALEMLRLLNTGQRSTDLSAFVREFSQRFDLAKIPLLEALDTDIGINYGNLQAPANDTGHLKDMSFPILEPPVHEMAWGAVHQLLFRIWNGDKFRDAWAPLHIGKEDINDLKGAIKMTSRSPQTRAVMYRNTGDFLVIEHAAGVTATSLIGRFSCFSDGVYDLCRRLARIEMESNPQVVFADIGQLSDTHVDNINRRKRLYDYEIPVNVFPEVSKDKQILPEDLWLSVENEELILESRGLGKRVIPRLSTAYNFNHNHLPVFRLLCDLQYQQLNTGGDFDLEAYFPGMPFYPRVSVGQVVISAAKWKFNEADIRGLLGDAPEGFPERLKTLRTQFHLPRHVCLGVADQQLVFDLANQEEALFLGACLRGLKAVTIQEYFYPNRSVLSGNKPLAGQYIAFMGHLQEIYTGLTKKDLAKKELRRSFMFGSEWLYIKIFCSPRLSDSLLTEVIGPLVQSEEGNIRKWFFIRYTENGYHLRLRINADEKHIGEILIALNDRMAESGYDQLIKNYQGDVYQREIERYGAELLPQIEELFHYGSELMIWYLGERSQGNAVPDELHFGLITAKRMIESFFEDVEISLQYLKTITAGFLLEFKADKTLRTQMDGRFRGIRQFMTDEISYMGLYGKMEPLLLQVKSLSKLTSSSSLEKRYALLSNAVHMQLNRIFPVEARRHELLVYYFLEKFMFSERARKKAI
jgi:thiopeptide-type bacteriocin biosynthesis protein